MSHPRTLRRALALGTVVLGASLWLACTDYGPQTPTGPAFAAQGPPDLAAAIRAQNRHTPALLRIPGIAGTAVGLGPDGSPTVQILLERGGIGVPSRLDGIPVTVKITGRFNAFGDPTRRVRPAPVGYSVGHPTITAGTIGARVRDGGGNVYVLSNNHVLAASNDANLDDPAWQPGAFDGGTAADSIGYLWSFKVLDFSGGNNTMDAAIARSDVTNVSNATDAEGYGTPNGTIFGDADGDGFFDNRSALLGLPVKKFGRTTRLTQGTITGVNATLNVCYEGFIFCTKLARFVDQVIVEPGSFSDGGDSGSLIVSDSGNHPVGLLFAGSSTQTIANRIDLVLKFFVVTVDGAQDTTPPPPQLTDIAVTAVNAPASVDVGDVANVDVTVRNIGSQNVTTPFDVTLRDVTDGTVIGTETVSGLSAGAMTTVPYTWNTTGASIGAHDLVATHDLPDDNGANDSASTTVTVNDPAAAGFMHVGDLDGLKSNDGSTWTAIVEVTVHDGTHQPLDGATVTGTWSIGGLASTVCTTGELGGNGTCIMVFPGIRKNVKQVTFTVTSVIRAGTTYSAGANHDVDGSSNGTSVTVQR